MQHYYSSTITEVPTSGIIIRIARRVSIEIVSTGKRPACNNFTGHDSLACIIISNHSLIINRMKYQNLKLDNQLCFALYSATHAITRAYRSALEGKGLTYPQYLVLLVLWESGGLTVKHIAERLDLDSASLTPILKRLESAGLLTRARNQDDERIVDIGLTERGYALQDEVAAIQKRVACQTGLSPEEFDQLKSSLHKLVALIRARQEPESEASVSATC